MVLAFSSNRTRPDRVLLAGQEHRQRDDQGGGVVELGQDGAEPR